MLLFEKEHLYNILDKQSRAQAVHDLLEEGGDIPGNRKRINESYEFYRHGGKYTLDCIFEQFRWHLVAQPFEDGQVINEWKHEASSIEYSNFNGELGNRFLTINHSRLDTHLDDYLSNENSYLQSEYLNRWLVDMLIYAECRLIALESFGRVNFSYPKHPFWRFKAKKLYRSKLIEVLPEAVRAYRCLDETIVDWNTTLKVLNGAYNNGISWRDPLPNLVHELSERANAKTKPSREVMTTSTLS
ncbi:MAG: hypothetical protein V3U65_18185 [Granulosicoccaceae bacterium]